MVRCGGRDAANHQHTGLRSGELQGNATAGNSVAGNVRIHLLAPGINATGDIDAIDAMAFEGNQGLGTAAAQFAMHVKRLTGGEITHLLHAVPFSI